VIVGVADLPFFIRAVRWVDGGPAENLVSFGGLLSSASSVAYDVSEDGSIIVGWSNMPECCTEAAFRWTEETGMVALPLPVEFQSYPFNHAYRISGDGRAIFGNVSGLNGPVWRWTAEEGSRYLGFESWIEDVNHDGSVIVGWSPPFLWDECAGLRTLREWLLERFDLDMGLTAPFRIDSVNGVSADGRTLVGTGFNENGDPEGFVIRLPAVAPGDFDDDGVIDEHDGAALVDSLRGPGSPYPPCRRTDLNADGATDLRDFAIFQRRYASACDLPADYNDDCAVDNADAAHVAGCLAGPDVLTDCPEADFDGDEDTDLADFAAFQRMAGGGA
jgi:hypothetical protein